MKLFANYSSKKNKNFYKVELAYSSFMWISGNKKWFCRIWRKDWVNKLRFFQKPFGESYAGSKYEAYRLALKDLYTIQI